VETPLVSVIVPFFNSDRFLSDAVESVLSQTYRNWELFLVDDGSNDESTRIARDYCSYYSGRIRYLHHSDHANRGQAMSRNVAIDEAKGTYVAFLDADDVWMPQKLEQQVAILEQHSDVGMVYGPALVWFGWTDRSEDLARDYETVPAVTPNTIVQPPILALRCYPLGKECGPHPSCVLLRRSLLDRIGTFEEQFPRLYDDQALFAKVYLSAPVFVAGKCWLKYRQHPHSCCAQMGDEYHATRLRFLNWLSEYLDMNGIHHVALWGALERSMWRYRHPARYRCVQPALTLCKSIKGLLRLRSRMRFKADKTA
jgi:glycosyltransferase involved in cell wall biosynthesis